MPLGFHCLHDVDRDAVRGEQLVDVVAVHDVNEDSIEAWTDPESGVNWLQSFLPKQIRVARVLAYGYKSSISALFADDAHDAIQRMAESLVQELRANRKLAKTLRRPIIFVCHGFGGVLVKQSLVYSSTRTAHKVAHLWDQFVSTFAIMFFGTPHAKVDRLNWLDFEGTSLQSEYSIATGNDRLRITNGIIGKDESQAANTSDQKSGYGATHNARHWGRGSATRSLTMSDTQVSQIVHNEFLPLSKQFHLFFFWEKLPTSLGGRFAFLVDPKSAAPKIDNTEAAGLHATHFDMAKFSTTESSGYRTAISALTTYGEKAPSYISRRWRQADETLGRLKAGQMEDALGLGFDIHLEAPFHGAGTSSRQFHFHVPDEGTPTFIGRQDLLRELRSAFFPDGYPSSISGQKSLVVFGMGGSGKTKLCSKYAYDNKHEYTAVFTIRAASEETIKDSYCRIGSLAGLEPTESAGRHFLDQQQEPWLLIIDNADDRHLQLHRFFPHGGSAHILLTTRVRDFGQHGTLGSMEVKGLQEADALHLLLINAKIPQPWDAPTTEAGSLIAKALGYLALALIQAGTCVYRGICKLGDYLDKHSSARRKLQGKVKPPKGDYVQEVIEAVYSTFDVSLGVLQKQMTVVSQDASELLKMIAFFHFEFIPLEIFERAVSNRNKILQGVSPTSFKEGVVNAIVRRIEPSQPLPSFLRAQGGELDKYRIDYAIAELQSLSLIRRDANSISLHPLIHSWARDSLTASRRFLWASLALNTLSESISLPPDGSSESDGEFHRAVVPHLETCLAENGNPVSEATAGMGKARLQISKFLQPTLVSIIGGQARAHAKFGWVFAERGRFEKAAIHLEIVHDMLVKILGEESQKAMSAALGLAGVYWGLGRLEEAITLQRAVVTTRSRIFGPTDERTLQAMDQLGRSYWLHGQYNEALELQETTSKRLSATLGEKHPQTLSALDNLGVTLGAWHRYRESLEIHQRVLAARTELLGETHLDTLTTKGNLGMALLDLGRLEEAKAAMTELHHQREKQLGKEHPWTLWAVCYLAKINTQLGLLAEAEEMLNRGIEAGVRSLSDDHLGVLVGRGTLALIYAWTNRLEEAERLTVDTINKIEKTRGISHADCVYALWRLARLYVLMGRPERAIETCALGIQRAEMRLTRKHPLVKELEELIQALEGPSQVVLELREQKKDWSNTKLTASLAQSSGSTDSKRRDLRRRFPRRISEVGKTVTW